MHYPWTFVIGLKANGDVIPRLAYVNDITSNGVHEVIGRIPCTSNNSEIMLSSGKILSVDRYCNKGVDMIYPMKMDRMLR